MKATGRPCESTGANLSNVSAVVLGAGGFIGTNLCRALGKCAGSVSAFGRRHEPDVGLLACPWISGDFNDAALLGSVVEGRDVVYHLVNSSTPASANADMMADLRENVEGTLRLLEACRLGGVRRVVFVSSGGTVYGVPKVIPTPESAPTDPITAYGISKLAIEKYLALYERMYGLEYRVLRVANPYGPFQIARKGQGVISAFIESALKGRAIDVWGDGSIIRDYVFIDDVVDALLLAATHDGHGRIFNIGSGEGRSLKRVLASVAKFTESDVEIRFGAARSVDVPVSVLDNSFAARNLGWRPATSFDDGIVATIAWMNEHIGLVPV